VGIHQIRFLVYRQGTSTQARNWLQGDVARQGGTPKWKKCDALPALDAAWQGKKPGKPRLSQVPDQQQDIKRLSEAEYWPKKKKKIKTSPQDTTRKARMPFDGTASRKSYWAKSRQKDGGGKRGSGGTNGTGHTCRLQRYRRVGRAAERRNQITSDK